MQNTGIIPNSFEELLVIHQFRADLIRDQKGLHILNQFQTY